MTGEREVPMPPVKRGCRACFKTRPWLRWERVGEIVSPSGIAHVGLENGDTACGKDATRDGWWWPV